MTSDEIKSAITGWCSHGTGIQLVEDRSEPGAEFVLGLRAAAPGSAGTVPVEARLEQGGERVAISSTSTARAGAEELRQLLEARPASVTGASGADGAVVRAHVYTDGLNRQTFALAVDEVAKTRALVDALGGAAAAVAGGDVLGGQPSSPQADPWAPAESTAQPTPSYASAAASTLPQPSFGAASAGGSSYTPLSGQAAQPAPASAAFAPTHAVPPQGMQAWAAPDPNGAVVATLGGGLPIQVTEVRGAWARILCSNGWTGWVDGRIIGVAH